MSYQIPSSHYQSENFENSIRKSSYNSPHNFNEHHHRNRSVSNITSINSSARNSPTLSNSRPSSSGSSNCSTSPFLGSRSNLHSVGIGHPSNSGFKIKKPRSMAVKLLYLSCLAVGFMGVYFLLSRYNEYHSEFQTQSSSSNSPSSNPTSSSNQFLKDILQNPSTLWSSSKKESIQNSQEDKQRMNGDGQAEVGSLGEEWKFAEAVDLVYTFVNGSEPDYQKLRSAYGGESSVGSGRDRDNEDLRYSLRSVAEYMPWSKGKIYIVSPSPPEWLSLNHPRIHWIQQDDIIPKDIQPTFSSNSVEPYLHLIPNLSELFIYLNDDVFINKPVHPSSFFTKDGGIKQFFEPYSIKDDAEPFDKNGGVKTSEAQNDGKGKAKNGNIWLKSVKNTKRAIVRAYGDENGKLTRDLKFLKHAPFVMSKTAYFGMHARFNKELRLTASHKFRSKDDVITPLLHHAFVQYEGSYSHGIKYEIIPSSEASSTMALVIWTSDPALNVKSLEQLESKSSDFSFFTINDSMGQNKLRKTRLEQTRLKLFYESKFGGFKAVFEKKN